VAELIGAIDGARQTGEHSGNLSSAIRVFVLDYYRKV
jgi:predicted DNA-binding ribbon-helix-helix protein